jgi:hypothetical protein
MKKPTVYIVAINLHKTPDARRICETLEGTEIEVKDTCHLLDTIMEKFPNNLSKNSQIMVAELSDFTTMCNDEEIKLEDWFIGYVYGK